MAEETTTLTYYVSGPATAATTLFFVHGFPDNHTLWDRQVAALCGKYRCVTVDLPNSTGLPPKEPLDRTWGYRPSELSDLIISTIRAVNGGKPVMLIGHDWGAIYCYKVQQKAPELVSKLVAMDIGAVINPGPVEFILIIFYQTIFMIAFLLGGPVGTLLGHILCILLRAPELSKFHASMCYHYLQFYAEMVVQKRTKFESFKPQCPYLFIYGTAGLKRLITFHQPKWADRVNARTDAAAVALPKAGHWMMLDSPDEVNELLLAFAADDYTAVKGGAAAAPTGASTVAAAAGSPMTPVAPALAKSKASAKAKAPAAKT